MSLEEDFRDLSFDLARILKKEIEKLEKKTEASINYIKEQTEKKIKKDLYELETHTIQEAIIELNKKVSDKITEVYQYITRVKANYIKKFIKYFMEETKKKLESNREQYFAYLSEHIQHYDKIYSENDILILSKQDYEYVTQHPEVLTLKKKLVPQPNEDIQGGFKIQLKDHDVVIDHTFSALIDLHYKEISIGFMKIFPVFNVSVENAEDIYEKIIKENKKEQ